MEYSPPPFFKRGPSLITRFAFFSILSIVLLVADARFGYLQVLRQAVAVVLYPLQRLSALPGELIERSGEFFVTQSTLRTQNQALQQQAMQNAADLQRVEALAKENDHLRQLLTMRERVARTTVAADILYAPRDPFSRRVVIDRGSQHDVKPGSAVIDRTGVIGQVTRVLPWVSEVTLITDKEQAVPIQVLRSGLRGVTFGIGYDGTLELRFMPVNADIQNGDVLVTSGIDGTYPAGLAVAMVENIDRTTGNMFAKIVVKPLAGADRSVHLLVLSQGAVNPPRPEEPNDGDVAKKGRGKGRRGG